MAKPMTIEERLAYIERVLRGEVMVPKLWAQVLRSGEHSVELGADYVQVLQGTPGNPPAGSTRFYSTADRNATIRDSSGNTDELVDAPTKEFFVLAVAKATAFPYTGTVGDYGVVTLTSTEDVDFLFHMPADFTTLIDAVVVTITDNTETLQWDVLTDFATNGEFYAANSDSIVNATLSVANDIIKELDVSAALTGLAADDYVGMKFASDTTQIRPIGLRIRYS